MVLRSMPELVKNFADEYTEGVRPHLTVALLNGDIALVGHPPERAGASEAAFLFRILQRLSPVFPHDRSCSTMILCGLPERRDVESAPECKMDLAIRPNEPPPGVFGQRRAAARPGSRVLYCGLRRRRQGKFD